MRGGGEGDQTNKTGIPSFPPSLLLKANTKNNTSAPRKIEIKQQYKNTFTATIEYRIIIISHLTIQSNLSTYRYLFVLPVITSTIHQFSIITTQSSNRLFSHLTYFIHEFTTSPLYLLDLQCTYYVCIIYFIKLENLFNHVKKEYK